MRNAVLVEQIAKAAYALLMGEAFDLAFLQMPDRGNGTGRQSRRQCRRENEARGKGADEVAQRGGCRDIAAHDAERLAERTLDHRQAVHQAFALGNAAAARAVHADRMHFIEIGHRAVFLGDVADVVNRRDVAIHRIDRFEGDEFWRTPIGGFASLASRSATELCLKITRSHFEWRMPSIIEAWLPASENTITPGIFEQSVPSAAQLDT